MKASWAGAAVLGSPAWGLWMARYTEYSVIFPEVTEGGSQVRWAPSGLCVRNTQEELENQDSQKALQQEWETTVATNIIQLPQLKKGDELTGL